MPTTIKPATVPVTVMMTVNIEKRDYDDMVEFLSKYRDVFGTGYIGYWAFGMPVAEKKDGILKQSWLLYEMMDVERPLDAECDRVAAAFKAGKKLPQHWHYLDPHAVIVAGTSKYGEKFCGDYDASTLDNAIQMALLGELRYC